MNPFKIIFLLLISQSIYSQIELWGVTSSGGQFNSGTIFKYLPETNTHTVVHNFNNCEGQPRVNHLIKTSTGRYIGTSDFGGSFGIGTISEYNEVNNTFAILYNFDYNTGNEPIGKLIEAPNGIIYGVTKMGGVNDSGVLFSFDPNSNIYVKHIDFEPSQTGKSPTGPLVIDNNFIYGTTSYGGLNGFGSFYKFDYTSNTIAKILDFDGQNNGKFPNNSLMKASNGNFYGDTKKGGTFDKGSIFEYNPSNNTFTKKIDLDGTIIGDSLVGSMVQPADGMLYGISDEKEASYGRFFFQYNPSTNLLLKKAQMGGNEFLAPKVGLALGSDDKLYYYRYSQLYKYNYQQNIVSEERLIEGSIKNILIEANAGKFLLGVAYDITTAENKLVEYNLTSHQFSSKYLFGKAENGHSPRGSLFLSNDGKFYGTLGKGSDSYGAIFCFDPKTNVYNKLSDFNSDFWSPFKSLIQAKNGIMYGMTSIGGSNYCGVIYRFDPITNLLQKVHDLGEPNKFYHPFNKMILANNGKLYGLLIVFSANDFLFEFDPTNNQFTKKVDFIDSIGLRPAGSLMQSQNGNLYGYTFTNSTHNKGSIYEYSISNNQINLKYPFDGNFENKGWTGGTLTETKNGKLYGVIYDRGTSNLGEIFSFEPISNSFTTLFSFTNQSTGIYPAGPLTYSIDNNLYGYLTNNYNNYGGVFKFNPETNIYNKLIDFNGLNGKNPESNLIQRIATITTTKSGNWNDPTVWENGVVPSNTSYITINPNHIIDIDGVPLAIKYVEVKGILNLLNGGSLNLVE